MPYSNSEMNCKASSKSKFAAVVGHMCDEHPMTAAVPGRGKMNNLYLAINSHNYIPSLIAGLSTADCKFCNSELDNSIELPILNFYPVIYIKIIINYV